MKNRIKKMISLTMVLILLLAAFAGCEDAIQGNKETTPSANIGQTPADPDNKEEQDDHTFVFTIGDLEPLSKEKQLEVEEAWLEKMGKNLAWRINEDWFSHIHRYYGVYNDCVVIFEQITCDIDVSNFNGGIDVGNQKIESFDVEEVWVYHNGEFVDINTAYNNKLLSDDDISAIVKYNAEFNESVMGR